VLIAAGLFVVLVLLIAVMALMGRMGVARIDSKEVAVVVNYLTGSQTVVTTPGYRFYMPLVQDVFILDKTQQKFVMQGEHYIDENHTPKLTVRASDGSSFYFEEMPVQYELKPEMADVVLNDSGAGSAYKQEWVKAYARSILRDEFGRFTAIEAANPTIFDQARIEARRRLNEMLDPHGIEVVLIGTPNPKFDAEYEQTIEERKSADQEVERLVAESESLVEARGRQLEGVKREKGVELASLDGNLKKALREAEKEAIEMRYSAQAYVIERNNAAEEERFRLTEQARGLEARYRKEAEGLASRAEALEQRGQVVVREALIEKLSQIRFTLVPYSRDPAPNRLEHVNAAGTSTLVDETVLEEGGDR